MNSGTPTAYLDFGTRLLVLGAALFLLTVLVATAQAGYQVGPVWPLAGLGFAVMWFGGMRWWPAVFLAQTGFSLYSQVPLPTAIAGGWIETLSVLLMLAGVRRFRVTPDFGSPQNVTRFLAIACAVSTVPASAFLLVMSVAGRPILEGALGGWGLYWLGEVMSYLIFTPAVLVAIQQRPLRGADWRRFLPAIAPLAAAAAILPLLERSVREPLFYMLLPAAVFAAAYGGLLGAVAAAVLLVVVLLALSALGEHGLLELWVRAAYVTATTLTALLIAAFWLERQRVQDKLAFQALHDPLTGLANRLRFEQGLRDLLAGGGARAHACLYLDLDQFKLLNDTCGHAAGDRLLEALAGDLTGVMPERATLARLGGDEFGALLPDASEAEAVAMAESLGAAAERFDFSAGGSTFRVSGSMGITLFESGGDDSPDSVLGRAEVACQLAKGHGSGGCRIYRPDDETMLRRHSAVQTISQLRNALDSGRMSLHAQRIVRIGGTEEDRARYELLLRMEDSTPGEFLPLVNRYGMMRQLDEWVLDQAGAALRRHPDCRLSVNISSRTLDSDDFRRLILEVRARHGFRPDQLCLEVTETLALENLLGAVRQLVRLRRDGFLLALDDFGAGVASFGYLQQLPVSQVKLDGRFVRDLATNPSSRVIVRSLVELARIRKIECVAEGVQHPGALDELKRLGVEFAQGFALHRPEPMQQLLERDSAEYLATS